MTQTKNWGKPEVKPLTLEDEVLDLVMLWLSLPMLLVVLLWATLRLPLSLLGRMLTGKTHYLELFLIKISIWWSLLKVRLKLGRLNRQKTKSGPQSSQTTDQSNT